MIIYVFYNIMLDIGERAIELMFPTYNVIPMKIKIILEWTTRLNTSSRTLFVRDSLTHSGRRMSTSRRTSSYVIT